MDSEVELIEGRLKSFLGQFEVENGILDRVIYKNKNQHRRCSYFQYLLKVRRNLKLLHSIHVEELLDSCFNVITGKKAKAKAHFLETLKRRKCDGGNFNFLERLLGVARLLSEMVEPILKTAIEISILLARTFFMGFSVMILALLGRVRVLVQQMLLDVVSLYNKVTSVAQKKQSIKISQDGIEVFREYYPMMEEVVTLDCVWETDKFVLVENSNKVDASQVGNSETEQSSKTSIKYRSIGISLADDERDPAKNDVHESGLDDVSNLKRKRHESPAKLPQETNQIDQFQIPINPEGDSGNTTTEGSVPVSSSIPTTSSLYKPNNSSNKKVAFISVGKPAPTAPNAANEIKCKMQHDNDNSLFNFFSEDDSKGSIF
ncbi:hypothetical protein RND81_04G227000 [Saponaria officinalis]|uniref:Nucleolus and neural progenitor protein-like N-terminal domain-containing protein n=1 Tax=Saponaria officinalis TaxID=3572 RepID=A0AAW1LKU5_SAPOF